MSVEVRPLDPARRSGWDAFVRSHVDGSFFHLTGWGDVIEGALGHRTHYLEARQGTETIGVLPLAEVSSRLFGHALISTPLCAYGGAIGRDAQVVAVLEDAAAALAATLGVDYLELRNRRPTRPDWPTKDLYVTFRKAISADHEQNLAAIPRKQRAMVRKGIAKQLTARSGRDVATLYDLYSESLRNLGTPVFSPRVFEALLRAFPDETDIVVVSHEDQPLAAVMNFYFRDEVLPYYGGGVARARDFAANDFMYWEVMRAAAERGCRVFDYGRSKRDTGSFSFKTHWGFEPTPLAYQYHLVRATAMPNLSPTNPRYQRAIEVWRRLPLRLTQLVGPPIAKYLG
jgi:FemAB-related protein (PEP-CTERM system-associated)